MEHQKKIATAMQLPLWTPKSSWVRLSDLPNLTSQKFIAIDLETKDDGLRSEAGPGWAHNAGYITGVSVAWEDQSTYFPVQHPDSDNFSNVDAWIKDHFATGTEFIFHNAPYDLGWFKVAWGIQPPAKIHDTTAMAVMVDENRYSYALDDVCAWRGIVGKNEKELNEAAACFGFHGKEVKHNLWRLSAKFVGPYAEADARATLALYHSLMPDLQRENVVDAYQTEMGLIPLCLEMRRRGIRIDEDAAYRVKQFLEDKRDEQLKTLSSHFGQLLDLNKIRQSRWLEEAHDKEGISYPRTPKTDRGSFTAGKGGWMRKHPHWLPKTIASCERYAEAADKFVQGFILDFMHKGRLHASINQFRNEEGGTRSHRFSYSNPPLQQMPERDDEIGPLIRGLFLPEEGEIWGAHDYSQQEYRIIVHVASILKCNKADEAVKLYNENPNIDFHGMVVEWTGLDRKSAKDVNFAKAFGAGVKKFAAMIGRDKEEAEEIYHQYDQYLPFVSEASSICSRSATNRGFIKLVDGARCHFELWEAADRSANYDAFGKYLGPRPLAMAKETWPKARLRRAFTHKAFNRYVQGSAARQTKKAMLACWREGLVPMLQMHDDLNFSQATEAQGKRVAEIMRDVVKLAVPMKVDSEYGRSWGRARKSEGYDASWKAAKESE